MVSRHWDANKNIITDRVGIPISRLLTVFSIVFYMWKRLKVLNQEKALEGVFSVIVNFV